MSTTKKTKRPLDPIWIRFPDLLELAEMLKPVYSYATLYFHRNHRVLPPQRFRTVVSAILRIPERELFNLEDQPDDIVKRSAPDSGRGSEKADRPRGGERREEQDAESRLRSQDVV